MVRTLRQIHCARDNREMSVLDSDCVMQVTRRAQAAPKILRLAPTARLGNCAQRVGRSSKAIAADRMNAAPERRSIKGDPIHIPNEIE